MTSRRTFLRAAALAAVARPLLPAADGIVRAVVAADGGGDFTTVQRAIDHVLDRPPATARRVILELRPGRYAERVKIPRGMPPVTLLGSATGRAVITASVSAAATGGTFFSPVVEVNCDAFEAENITFENSFGLGSQALAASIHSDRARFRKCRFLGWQDTLYTAWGRHHYVECEIEGHVDFIFGAAAAVFDSCRIHSRGAGHITAHFRTAPDQPTGFVFRNCRLTGEEGLLAPTADLRNDQGVPYPAARTGKGVSLGRPWRPYARAIYLDCWMGEHIRPEGWDNWNSAGNNQTAWFGEYGSTGPGARMEARVPWCHKLTEADIAAFQPEVFLK